MKEIYIVAVGKLKSQEIESLESEFLKRINSPKVTVLETKTFAENCDLEALEVIKKINEISSGQDRDIYTLEESGKLHNSLSFADWIKKIIESDSKKIFFVLGGASGHGKAVLEQKKSSISLSPLTFPHKIARLLLIEQIYRAQTIRLKHPYNK